MAPHPPPEMAAPRRRWALLAWLVVTQLLAALSLILWLTVAGLSVMAFDSGYSTEAALFVGAIWLYPLLPLTLAIASWVAYAKRRNWLAAILSALTVLPPALLLLALSLS